MVYLHEFIRQTLPKAIYIAFNINISAIHMLSGNQTHDVDTAAQRSTS